MVELVGKVSERGIRRSEVRFLMGTWEFFFVPRSWQDEKHLSLNELKFHLSKIYIYIYIFYVLYHRSHQSLAMTNRCSSIHLIVINLHIVSFFLSTCEVLIAILGFRILLNCDLNTTCSNLTHFAKSNIYFSGENV